LEYSLRDSIDILKSSDEDELERRSFLFSDNIEDGVDEQIEIENTFYNQLFVLLLSYIENYFEDILKLDFEAILERIDQIPYNNEIVKNLLQKYRTEYYDSIVENRRKDKIKFIFDLTNYDNKQKNNFFRDFTCMALIRDSIIHNKGFLKRSKNKDKNNFEIFLKKYDIEKAIEKME
jgi:hypothetical protein